MIHRFGVLLTGLGLLAGAVLPVQGAAQTPADTLAPPVTDTTRARADTVPVPRDSVLPPFAPAELPGTIGIAEPNRWRRPHFIGTGSNTLLDLIERIPGITSFHTGWIASPQHAAYLGNAARLRVFLDGVELMPQNPEAGVVADLHDIPLWALDEVSVERGADEVRVYARSWSVERTTTLTRTDFETGDANTNLYRAFAGRRWQNGVGVQGAVEQYATSAPLGRGGGDQLTLLARGGWARGAWSADLFSTNGRRTRDAHPRLLGTGGMERFRANRSMSYARLGYGHPERGAWAQLLGVTRSFRKDTPLADGQDPDTAIPDSTLWQAQFIGAAGTVLGPSRLSVTNRVHVIDGDSRNALEGRALVGGGPLSLALRTERRNGGLGSVEEASLAFTPLRFVGLSGAVARRTGGTEIADDSELVTARAEASLRLGRLWLSGGVLRRGETTVPGLAVFDEEYVSAVDPEATAVTASARGRVWRNFSASVWMVRWEEAGWYRPQLQVHAELFLHTQWLSRFPRGNLEIFASAAIDHRSAVLFPRAVEGEPLVSADVTPAMDYFTARVEVRLLDAVLFWQQRLSLVEAPQYVPGYMPIPAISYFGLRWNFWN